MIRRSGHSSSALAIPLPDALLRLLAGLVREADDGEPGHAALEVGFHLHRPSLEADEGVGDGACEHTSTVGRTDARACVADCAEVCRAG